VALGEQYKEELDGHGWEPSETAALAANVAVLEVSTGAQATAQEEAGGATVDEHAALDKAKGYIRRLRNALPKALRLAPDAGVTLSSFETGEALGRSTPKISAYLARIRPLVQKLDTVLAKAFKGTGALVELDRAKSTLDGADAAQELARKNAPDATQSLHETMGKVLEQVQDMNRAGRSAFDGDAKTAAKFNKDVLLRGRKAASKKAPEAGGTTATTATTGTTTATIGASGTK
jgi:hypothetical protein